MQRVRVTGEVWKEGNMYTAYCSELDVASCGKTVDEAWGNLKEAIGIFIEETDRKGTLKDLLEEAGFSIKGENFEREEHLVGNIERVYK